MSLNNQAQTLPSTPAQVNPSGFNLSYFFQQWATIAQVINANASLLTALQSQVNGIVIPTPSVQVFNTVQTDVTSKRVFGSTYRNSSKGLMLISGHANQVSGSSVGSILCSSGITIPSLVIWQNESTATVAGAASGFAFSVPPGYFYKIAVSGDISATPGSWIETVITIS